MTSFLFALLPLIITIPIMGLFIWQAVWVALDSRKKGEEYWWLWTIAAVMSFPIGLIVYVLVTRSDRNKCNNCGREVPKNLGLCPYCGQKCGYFCSDCGQKVQSGWRYCPNCTHELPEEVSRQVDGKKNNKVMIVIISILLAVFLFFIVTVVLGVITFSVNKEVRVSEVLNEQDRYSGYSGIVYDEATSEVKSYNASGYSFWYKGERKKGEIIIRTYDNNYNLISESEPIEEKEFVGTVLLKGVSKIEVELKNFKGSFYMRYN